MGRFWVKDFAVIVSQKHKQVTLCEFLTDGNGETVQLVTSEDIHTSEFSEYIEDTKNWLPIKKWVEDIGIRHHWSGIKVIRLLAKIENEFILNEDEMIWAYRRAV